MLVVSGVVVQGGVLVERAVAMHGLVEAVPGALQGGAELTVAARIGARCDGVDVRSTAGAIRLDEPR